MGKKIKKDLIEEIEAVESKKVEKPIERPTIQEIEDPRKDFKKFFMKVKRQLNLSPSLENVIWLHFVSYGFDKKEKFQEGLKHFGY